MRTNMKSSRIKKVVVKGAGWDDQIDVDSDIHDDFLLEAATQALEKRKRDPGLQVAAVIHTYEKRNEKNPLKHFVYNSYLVMVNASMYKQAEYLRSVYLKKNKIDLRSVNLREDNKDGGKPTNN